jgi:hypothetical protein
MLTLPGGGILAEPGGLMHGLGEVLREVTDVPAGFLAAAEDAFDVHLRPEPHHVRRLGQLGACLLERGQRRPGVRVDEGLGPRVPDRHPVAGVDELGARPLWDPAQLGWNASDLLAEPVSE